MSNCSSCGAENIATVQAEALGFRFISELTDVRSTVFDPAVNCEAPALDVSTATALQMKFKLPDGSTSLQTAVFGTVPDFAGDGSDGVVQYVTTSSSFLTQVGTWFRQVIVTMPSGTHRSEVTCFRVLGNL